jgi:hypothetical protein
MKQHLESNEIQNIIEQSWINNQKMHCSFESYVFIFP